MSRKEYAWIPDGKGNWKLYEFYKVKGEIVSKPVRSFPKLKLAEAFFKAML